MTFSSADLAARLRGLEQQAGAPARYVIAFSGGLDSTVLAHALAKLGSSERGIAGRPIVAIHVDHQLQDESASWCEQCRATAANFGIEFQSLVVTVPPDSGKGPEAAAREVRYAAINAELGANDWLLSAHHREDQAETLLLNLVRGSGPAGVAGIGELRRFGPGWLVRPLLDVDRAALEEYAKAERLQWLEDPSNRDRRFDRNFLRHEVLPTLRSRWPDIAARLQRSADLAGEASRLLRDLAAIDLGRLGGDAARLPVDGLSGLPLERQRNLIRYAARSLGLPTPPALQLERILTEVMAARPDAQPLVTWPGASVRRYRDRLYLLPEEALPDIETGQLEGNRIELGLNLGVLHFRPGAALGLQPALFEAGLVVRRRAGGEQFVPYGHKHTRKLKKLLQEQGVVPWMRDSLPLIYCGERLLAVGDLWMAADAVAEPGVAVHWSGRPALH